MPGLGRIDFSRRIVIVLVATLLAMQAATLLIVDVTVDRNVGDELAVRIDVGDRIWRQLQADRDDQLRRAVSTLAADFAFREAVATGDAMTVLSALLNHGERIGADVSMLLGPDGTLLASTLDGDETTQAAALSPLLGAAERGGSSTGIALLGDVPYSLAVVPVMAPHRIGWVAMGRSYGRREAYAYRSLTGLDAALLRSTGTGWRVLATSLDAPEALGLAALPALPSASSRLTLAQRHFHAGSLSSYTVGGDIIHVLLLADIDRAMRPYLLLEQQIVLLATLASLLALGVAVVVGRSVSRPVARLAAAAARIESGDYAEQLPVPGDDEFSGLARAFNSMQNGIAERERRIRHQALHDQLTGLPNRANALAVLDAALATARREGRPCAVLMIDLDRFKEINDTLGHVFGDSVLKQVSQRLRGTLGARDLLARMGGDEFMVLIDAADGSVPHERAWAVVQALDAPLDLPLDLQHGLPAGLPLDLHAAETRLSIRASVGVALYPAHADCRDTLLRRADIAMYAAKAAHQRVAVYEAGDDETHLRRVRLMADLRNAQARDEFHLVYQPKIDLRTRRPAHVEVLLRWRHPELGPIPPDEFIPLAEHCGLIHELTTFVLSASLRQVAEWRAQGLAIGLAVNLSPMDLLDAQLAARVDGLLREHAVSPAEVILEITESTVMRDIKAALVTMQALRALGVRLSIDDFGTGHSSLAQLRSLPVDEIKIDKSFVMRLDTDPDDTVIVRSAIEIGHNMGLVVIAEGVESTASLEILHRLRCDMAQGYLFSRPVPAEDFRRWHAGFEPDPVPCTCPGKTAR